MLCIYPNLSAEMARRKITQGDLSKLTGRTPTTISFKLQGKSIITLTEAIDIRDAIDKSLSLDYLYQKEITQGENDE